MGFFHEFVTIFKFNEMRSDDLLQWENMRFVLLSTFAATFALLGACTLLAYALSAKKPAASSRTSSHVVDDDVAAALRKLKTIELNAKEEKDKKLK